MSTGNTVDATGLRAKLGDYAVSIRDAHGLAEELWGYIITLGADQAAQEAGLVALGFTQAEAAQYWLEANYGWSQYQLYHGQEAQPSPFSFHDGLAAARGAS